MLSLEVAILSEVGGRQANEDACGHWHSDHVLCCVLADGAGGHGGGAVASQLAVQHVIQQVSQSPQAQGEVLASALRSASAALIAARVPGGERADMHSTAVVLAIDYAAHTAAWAHAGDSRLYWLRQGSILAQTRDHSLVQSLADAGMLGAHDLRSHPRRSELRSALGLEDSLLEVSHAGPQAGVQPGDVFLLCSDGLWEHVHEQRLLDTLAQAPSTRAWLDALEHEVSRPESPRRGHDNFTALVVRVHALG